MKLRRYDIPKLMSNPEIRRDMIIRGTRSIQAMEGIDLTYEEVALSYDKVMAEKKLKKVERK